jgi:hypothetical protein
MKGLDAWITSGRYRQERILAICGVCGEETPVLAETEYGATFWSPEECEHCGTEFDAETPYVSDEPPEPDWREIAERRSSR